MLSRILKIMELAVDPRFEYKLMRFQGHDLDPSFCLYPAYMYPQIL